MELILASASPRRQQMLRDLGVRFRIESPDIDEKRLRGEPGAHYARRLASEKADCVAARAVSSAEGTKGDWAVLAADTVVIHRGQVLGKPVDAADAQRMLNALSGRTHDVVTAYCWLGYSAGETLSAVNHVRTRVTFAEMPRAFWRWYVATGEPMDKAGAYAAQGIGMSFIERVSGSYSNVVGLPLSCVLESFEKLFGGSLRERCGPAR
jgi:septum formation protein